jgi:glycosyltransferase involved in cell wall biosynthesis
MTRQPPGGSQQRYQCKSNAPRPFQKDPDMTRPKAAQTPERGSTASETRTWSVQQMNRITMSAHGSTANAAVQAPPAAEMSHAERPERADVQQRQRLAGQFAINGKFASQRMTGVQRTGYELAVAFLRLFPDNADLPLLLPVNAREGVVLPKAKTVFRSFKGTLWEQIALPFATGGRTLLSLCNIGPLFARRQVLMIHDVAVYDLPENYSWKYRLWYRVAYAVMKSRVASIVTVSEFSKQRIVERLRIPADRISVVPNGVDHFDRVAPDARAIERLGLQRDGYVLIVGNLSVGKNLARVLAAVEQLGERHDWKFVVVGSCDLKVFNSSAKTNYEQSKSIVQAGFVSDGELRALYEQAGCFVFPSLYEGFGLPPLEAMSCGCPVVTSREASLPEVCGDAAVYCDARSVDDIAAKIAQVMNDATLRDDLRRRGRERAKRFTWDNAARRLLDAVTREAKVG